MTDEKKARFAELCLEDRIMYGSDGEGIGTYNEKRFHRIFKRLVTDDADCYEVKVGRYIADVKHGSHITEIQTGSFRTLADKIRYYLTETDCNVSVIKPVICEKRIIRADKDTGEIKYTKRSPKKETVTDALSEVYYLRELVDTYRLSIHFVLVRAEEYRYSERMRYRKKGKYDNDLCPCEIVGEKIFCGLEDYVRLLPEELCEREFTVAEYSRLTGIKGKPAYSVLHILTASGVLDRRTEKRSFIFKRIKK